MTRRGATNITKGYTNITKEHETHEEARIPYTLRALRLCFVSFVYYDYLLTLTFASVSVDRANKAA